MWAHHSVPEAKIALKFGFVEILSREMRPRKMMPTWNKEINDNLIKQ